MRGLRVLRMIAAQRLDDHSLQAAYRIEVVSRPDHPDGGPSGLAIRAVQVVTHSIHEAPIGILVALERRAGLAPVAETRGEVLVPDLHPRARVQQLATG